jgi:hypothetical protein
VTDYAGIARNATKAIRDNGQIVTLRRLSAGTYDPATRKASPGAPVDSQIPAVFFDVFGTRGNVQQYGKHKEPDGTITVNRICLLSALDVNGSTVAPPNVDDELIDAIGRVYSLVSIEETAPAGQPVMFTLGLSGSE